MKAITIWQPFASLLVYGKKPVENRTWKPSLKVGDAVAIHAGKASVEVSGWMLDEMLDLPVEHAKTALLSGVILGTMVYQGVISHPEELPTHERKWFFGPFGWVLRSPVPLKTPVKIRGAQGLWKVPEDIAGVLGSEGKI